jgi:ribonuclease HI
MITYYTDGSCEPNPGAGGYAVIRVTKNDDGTVDMKPAVLGSEPGGGQTTNIRMEGYAVMSALKDAGGQECEIYTDSEFWINVITKWSLAWEAKNWVKKGGEIKNLDIVKEVCPLFRNSNATLIWVRGHNNDPGNEMADHWANEARKQAK